MLQHKIEIKGQKISRSNSPTSNSEKPSPPIILKQKIDFTPQSARSDAEAANSSIEDVFRPQFANHDQELVQNQK